MEPIVMFGAGVVVYFSYCALVDVFHDLRGEGLGELLEPLSQRLKPGRRIRTTVAAVSDMKRMSMSLATCTRGTKQVSANCAIAWQRQSAL